MKYAHALPSMVLSVAVSMPLAYGQTPQGYRNFELGGTLSSVSATAKTDAASAKTIHARPALMQELEWRAPYSRDERGSDPVQQIVFSFYNDQLYKIVVDYDHSRTAGLTDKDMIEGISGAYGTPLKAPKRQTTARYDEAADGTSIARWGDDADEAIVLYRSADFLGASTSRYWLIVTLPRLDILARSANAAAIQLDEREAPQRAAAQQKKDAADARAAEETARTKNKAAFRP